jgi:hypothetical protein
MWIRSRNQLFALMWIGSGFPKEYFLGLLCDLINLTFSAGDPSDHHHSGGLPRRRYIHRLRCQGSPLMLLSSC